MSGSFVAVVGPSGAGKDSIIVHAQSALAARGDIVFPKRHITRPSGAGEDHRPVSEAEFESAERNGEFALTWRAHGLAYGIPAQIFDVVERGGVVVANVSRTVLEQLPELFPSVHVVRVTVSDSVRLARIVARGREGAAAAATRVARQDPAPHHEVDLEIVNDGTLEESSAELVHFLERVRRSAALRI